MVFLILYCDKILEIYPFYDIAVYFKTQALIASNKNLQFIEWSKFYLRNGHNKGDYKIFDSTWTPNKFPREYIKLDDKELDYIVKSKNLFMRKILPNTELNESILPYII
jgi:hypothetical protein